MSVAETTKAERSEVEKSAMRKVIFRLVPFLMLCYFLALLDRVNIGFAALQMNADLGLTPSMFGLAAGLYFWAYFLVEVPSNLALQKTGARVWIARIMISWGIISAAMAFVQGPYSLYGLRFLLGAAEAGFFPGALLLFTYWLPKEYRGRILAIFVAANALAGFLGSPISALLLELDGVGGLRGWQWMFVLEGLPTVFAGIAALFILADRPEQAKWLNDEERAWLVGRMTEEKSAISPVGHISLWQLARNKYFLTMALLCAGASSTSAVLAAWQPQILKAMDLTNLQVGFINSVPYGITAVVMILWARNSDRTRERRWHAIIPLSAAGLSFLALSFTGTALLPTVLLLTICLCGAYAFKGPFWALASEWLSPSTMAAGLAGITAISNLIGGGFMVNIVGIVKQHTDSFALGMLPIVAMTLGGSALCLIVSHNHSKSLKEQSAKQGTPAPVRT
ncbi:MFS transporter [Brucella intermedia]|uniref:MFS transporter n=1 Tax=Brucella intermedia TaxID=94625 RepID=UPI00224B2C49|nr:MFS transporter [Brucella intermedia]